MEKIETIKVKKKVLRKVNGDLVDIGYHIINKKDFDSKVHEIFDARAKAKEVQGANTKGGK